MQNLFNQLQAVVSGWKPATRPVSYTRSQVKNLIQIPLTKTLEKAFPQIQWSTEYLLGASQLVGDKVDIFGRISPDSVVIIEIDNSRADQVAKKFVSRMALSDADNVAYITLCYSNTNSKSVSGAVETAKYAVYLHTLTDVLAAGSGKEKYYAHITI